MSKKKKLIMLVFIISGGIITTMIIIFGIISLLNASKNESDYHEVKECKIPNNYIESLGTIKLPNIWEIINVDGWYVIYDIRNKKEIAYQVYKGYEVCENNLFKWVDYEENPIVLEYNYDDIYFDSELIKTNKLSYAKYNDLVKITFYKCDASIRNSTSFLFINVIDFYKLEWVAATFI